MEALQKTFTKKTLQNGGTKTQAMKTINSN